MYLSNGTIVECEELYNWSLLTKSRNTRGPLVDLPIQDNKLKYYVLVD